LLPALAAALLVGHVIGLRTTAHSHAHLDRALVAILTIAAGASIGAGAGALLSPADPLTFSSEDHTLRTLPDLIELQLTHVPAEHVS
jgi:hypothetical protein